MAWQRQGFGVIGLCAWLLSGCASNPPEWATPKQSLAMDISTPSEPRLARLQTQDAPPPVTLKRPAPQSSDLRAPIVLPTATPNGEIQQTSMANRGTVRISVRAWVNGRPIFDDEVMQMAGGDVQNIYRLPEAQRSVKMAELINNVIEQLVDQELMYQDACKKLEKANPKALGKLKQFVDQEFDKTLEKWKQAKMPEDRIRELEPVARRLTERNLISTEYARSRIMDFVKNSIGFVEIREYYEAHKNEFKTLDSVVWQDIFIPISPSLPTVDAVKRFSEDLLSKCRTQADFNRLMVYNEGPSKLNNGEGLGKRRGEIQPGELETPVFELREGEIGPVIPFSTGVHLIRVTKREYAGQLVLDHKVQNTIRKKLETELADREYRRIVRELRARAVVRLERNAP